MKRKVLSLFLNLSTDAFHLKSADGLFERTVPHPVPPCTKDPRPAHSLLPVSCNLLHVLESVLEGIANVLAMVHIDVPFWGTRTMCATSVDITSCYQQVRLTLAKSRICKKTKQ